MKKLRLQITNYKRISFVLFLLTFGITVCVSTQTGAAPPVPSQVSGLSQSELEIWNDPAFKKRFAESYMAETEIEPRVTTDERDKMQKVLDLISSDQMDKAASLLEKSRGGAANALYDFMLANIFFQQEKLDQAANI